MSLSGKTLMVAPFATPNASYFKSQIGAIFSRQIVEAIRAELPDAKLVTVDDVPTELFEGADVRISPVRVAHHMEADYLLYGAIYVLQAKEPKSIGILQGKMIVKAAVVDLAEGKVVWRTSPPEKKFFYPPRPAGIDMMPAQETDEEEVVRKVMLMAALHLASPFTGEDRSKDFERGSGAKRLD